MTVTVTVTAVNTEVGACPGAPAEWVSLDKTGGGGCTGFAPHPANADVAWISSDLSGVYKTLDQGDSWMNISYNLGVDRCGCVYVDPLDSNIIYVTASTAWGSYDSGGETGELHRSVDGGATWQFHNADGFGQQASIPSMRSIAIPYDSGDPTKYDADTDGISDVIVLCGWGGSAGNGGIWRSTDEGATFAQVGTIPTNQNMTAVIMQADDNDNMWACSWEANIYSSSDAGATWTLRNGTRQARNFGDIAVHPTDSRISYVTAHNVGVGNRVVQKTVDLGVNWSDASTGLDPALIDDFPRLQMDQDDSDILYVTTADGGFVDTGVYVTTNGATTWNRMDYRLVLIDGRPFFWYDFAGQIMIGQSSDGTVWAEQNAPFRYPAHTIPTTEFEPATIGYSNVVVQDIVVDPNDATRVWHGISDFGPYRSDDRGASFHRILGNGWPVTVLNYVWNGPYYHNYATCTGFLSAGTTTGFAVSHQDGDTVYSSFHRGGNNYEWGGINKTADAGATWTPVVTGLDVNLAYCVPWGIVNVVVDPTDDDIAYASQRTGTSSSKVYKTVNGGALWSSVLTSARPWDLAISEADPDVLVFVSQNVVRLTTNAGGAWSLITPASTGFRSVALSPHDANDIVIGTLSDGWWISDDQGGTWTHYEPAAVWTMTDIAAADRTQWNPAYTPIHCVWGIAWDPNDADTYYLAGVQRPYGGIGVIKCTNYGATWERLTLTNLGCRDVQRLALDASGEYLYAGGFDGLYRLEL